MGKVQSRPTASTSRTDSSVDAVSDDLQCGICLGAPISAHETEECGHLFCRDCIMKWLDEKKECPYCRKPLTRDGVRKSVWIQRKVQSLRVKCGNAEHGCEETCTVADLDRHMERCPCTEVKCPFSMHGCDAVISRKVLCEHLSACPVAVRLSQGDAALEHEMAIHQRANRGQFIWKIENIQSRRGQACSPGFMAHGLKWCLRHIPAQGGVFVVPVGHNKRASFTLTIFNTNQDNDVTDFDGGWPAAKTSWGFAKFTNPERLGTPGFVVDGCATVGVVMHGLIDD